MDKEAGAQAISGWGDRVPTKGQGSWEHRRKERRRAAKGSEVEVGKRQDKCFMAEWKDPPDLVEETWTHIPALPPIGWEAGANQFTT